MKKSATQINVIPATGETLSDAGLRLTAGGARTRTTTWSPTQSPTLLASGLPDTTPDTRGTPD